MNACLVAVANQHQGTDGTHAHLVDLVAKHVHDKVDCLCRKLFRVQT